MCISLPWPVVAVEGDVVEDDKVGSCAWEWEQQQRQEGADAVHSLCCVVCVYVSRRSSVPVRLVLMS